MTLVFKLKSVTHIFVYVHRKRVSKLWYYSTRRLMLFINYYIMCCTAAIPGPLKMCRDERSHDVSRVVWLMRGSAYIYIYIMFVYDNMILILWRAHRSWLLPVRDECEYESDQGHAATEDDDQGEDTLLARHRPSVARQVAHDGHPSWVNALHFGNPSKIRVYAECLL